MSEGLKMSDRPTDPLIAAMAKALHAANIDCDYSRKFDRKSCQPADGFHSIMAAAVLAALPPDWCGHAATFAATSAAYDRGYVDGQMLEHRHAEAEIARLRSALDRLVDFAWHKPTCLLLRTTTVSHPAVCNCGLTAALAAAKEASDGDLS